MRITLTVIISLFTLSSMQAQNPYKSIGKQAEVLTLSNGKYQEFIPNDTLVVIGSVIYNTITEEVVAFAVPDTVLTELGFEPEVRSRFLSVDPHASRYPSISPYAYVANNPLIYTDPDGRDIVLGTLVDRVLNYFGYKTENLQKIESSVNTLRSTETGNKLFNELDAREGIINLTIGENLENSQGDKLVGLTSFTTSSDEEGNLNITSDFSVKVDVDAANKKNNKRFSLTGNEGAATTVGHEFGHVQAILKLPTQATVRLEVTHGEGNKAEEVQRKVAKELGGTIDDEENNN